MLVKFLGNISYKSGDRTVTKKLEYQQTKIHSQLEDRIGNKAEIIYNSTEENDVLKIGEKFFERAEDYNFGGFAKKRKVENVAREIMISFEKYEELDNDRVGEICGKYLQKMGYEDCPYVVFRHHDTDNSHVHIICGTINDSMQVVKNDDDFKRSFKICRELEQEMGLEKLNTKGLGSGFKDKKLSEVSARKYYFFNALMKGLNSKNLGDRLTKVLSESLPLLNKKEPLEIPALKTILGEERFITCAEILNKGGFFNAFFKDELSDSLSESYKNSKNRDEFFKSLKEKGIYARMTKDKKITYGLKDVSFYLNEDRLPQRFRYINLLTMGDENPENKFGKKINYYLEGESENYIFSSLIKSFNDSSSLKEFTDKMYLSNIQIIKHSDKDFKDCKISELSFVIIGDQSERIISGSSLSKKLAQKSVNEVLSERISLNYVVPPVHLSFTKGLSPFTPIVYTPSLDTRGFRDKKERDPHLRKKKRKGIGDNERGAGVS